MPLRMQGDSCVVAHEIALRHGIHDHRLADDNGDWGPPPKLFPSAIGSTLNALWRNQAGASEAGLDLICGQVGARSHKRANRG
ncbi:hypothetical protein X740_16610 [Mesorhizobium sp. LNHC221B00]|nr:hypothetical protein X740_16610 [Mesorhizobium sp. LNHC221B00]